MGRRTLWICAIVIVAVAVAAAAATAANTADFTDPTEDNLIAMDISTVRVSNDDQGTVVFDIAIDNGQLIVCPEDILFVLIDTDRSGGDPTRGGADYYAAYDANGNTATGTAVQRLYHWSGSAWEQIAIPSGFGFSETDGTASAPLRFTLTAPRAALGNPSQINFWVATKYPDNPSGTFTADCRAPEAGDITEDVAPDRDSSGAIRTWSYHVMVDPDHDGVSEEGDNCKAAANADQADQDHDGIGNACDADVDGDSRPNNADNCPSVSNPGQEDQDSDGLGNACDPIPIDNTPPEVRALRALCDRPCPAGSIVQLPYTFRVREDRADPRRPNITEETAGIKSSARPRGIQTVKTGRKPNSAVQSTFTIPWRVPKNPVGWYTYCLQSSDLAGNTGKASCGPITFPSVEATPTVVYAGAGRGLRIVALSVGGLPGNSVVSIDCRARCSIHERARVSGASYASRKFADHHVPKGAQIEVRVTRPRWSGDYDKVTLGSRLAKTDGCLAPGQRRPAARRFCR